jgi:hypothetical protein
VILPANATRRRAEEAFLVQARLKQLEVRLDNHLVEMGAAAPAFPTEADIEEVGRLLVTGHLRLPRYATYTVTTEIEEVRSKVFGTSEIYHHTADQLCVHALQPMSIPAAIECKLLTKVGGHWLFRADVYRMMVPPDPRLLP